MNSCCCRSHSDRTDPMACLPQFPRLQRVQSCRPYLEGRKASCCMSSERRWGQRNGGMIQLLAKMVNKSSNTVCQFLHQLTLQLFARILYPLMLGWNTLKIPFVLPDTCELYYGIFDECGDLRKSIRTRTLLILVSMMQYFLNLPKGCMRNSKCPGCRNNDDSLKNIHNPGYCGKNAMTPFSGSASTSRVPSLGSEVRAGLRRLGYESYGSIESYPSDESIPYGYAPYRCPCQAGLPKPKRILTNPYANMGSLAIERACSNELGSPMLAADCIQRPPVAPSSRQAARLMHITQLSDLYAAVVQNQHSRQLLAEGQRPKQRIIPCTENRGRFSGGFMVPEPYFNGMPWSWLHRNPQRMVRLPSGGLPMEIPRYRRQPLDEMYDSFRSKYEDMSRQVNPFKENSLLRIQNYGSENRFQSISWANKIFNLQKLPIKNMSNNFRQIPIEDKWKMRWDEVLLKKVNQARQTNSAYNYWKDMMERNQLRTTFDHDRNDILSIRNPIFQPKDRTYSESLRMIRQKSSNSLRSASQDQKKTIRNQNKTKAKTRESIFPQIKRKPIFAVQRDQHRNVLNRRIDIRGHQ
ncbi:uncharacterized protein LOC108118423 [Drosophila eugracilis]|uniref:uncharacterized protein LOC108118423 n=1 Tax=Drosophila eugracilis TaxID=29029 RepID=UPI001BD9A385|nr:uncharacterized protein LOC108118423 [Drosophila eugracilis]